MGIAPYYDRVDVVDADLFVVPVTKVKKQIWNADQQQFEPRVFVRYKCSKTQYENGSKWLTDIYGPGKQYSEWWPGAAKGEIWMDEKIYTFWRLRLGYNE